MSQNYQIGSEFGVTFHERLEWRLNQIQSALGTGGSSPAVEALLTDLLAVMQVIQGQTDGIELTSENISLNADEINLNTDQVEALLAGLDAKSIDANLSLSLIQAQIAWIQPLINEVEALLTSLLASSSAIETQLLNIDSTSGDTNSLLATQGADVAVIRTVAANLLTVLTAFEAGTATDLNAIQAVLADQLIKLTQVYGSATNSEAALAAIDAHIVALQAQVGNTAALETRLIEVRDHLIAVAGSTDGLEGLTTAGNAKLDTLIIQTDGLETTLTNQLTATTAGNAKLDTLVIQTDGIEGGLTAIDGTIGAGNSIVADVRTAAQSIQVQTDQVEPLLTAINGQIASLQTQVGDTSALETRLIEVRDELMQQTGWLSNIGQELGNSTGNGGVISSLIGGRLSSLVTLNQQIYDQLKPLTFGSSNIYDVGSYTAGSPLAIAANPLCRKRSILNDSGESGGGGGVTPTVNEGWIFGSYRNASVSEDDFDFVVDPGETHVCDLPDSDLWLVCIAQSASPAGRFLIMEYQ
jgi:hypothetical protein